MSALAVGFVLFPNLTQLDLTGPLQVLHRLPGATVHIAAKTREPAPSDCGLGLVPTTTFAACPDLDLICVPGGAGVSGAIADVETVAFVRRQGGRATYVTSVCTGAFVLGAAGYGLPEVRVSGSTVLLIAGGLLVGFGTRLGGGCTSGHGVCGLARLSPRSLVATGVFMAVAAIVVFVARHAIGT